MAHVRLCFLLWPFFMSAVFADPQTFWAAHILNARFTGPANKDLANLECDVGFVAGFCFGEQKTFSDFNSEMHVVGTVFEWNQVTINQWQTGPGSYLSCCPPASKGNTGDYYRCNTWTTEDNDNCHTLNLPWNDGKIKAVGAQVPAGSKPVSGKQQWMYSFPAEGEGTTWTQGLTRRLKMEDLAGFWIQNAGGCQSCQGKGLEDPCYGTCVSQLGVPRLITLTHQALADPHGFPNYGIPGPNMQGIMFNTDGSRGNNKCVDLSGGNSKYGTAIDLWDCNGLVNQAWYWNDYMIQLGGHNLPGMCIDLPGANAYNGNKLWLWGCNGGDSQRWTWDSSTSSIRYAKNPSFCIDLPGANTQNGNQLWLWQCVNSPSQKWYLYKPRQETHKMLAASQQESKQPAGVSWIHRVKQILSDPELNFNYSRPADFVPWYEKKEVKEWYAAQMPGPGLPRPLVPDGWTGYNISAELTTVLV